MVVHEAHTYPEYHTLIPYLFPLSPLIKINRGALFKHFTTINSFQVIIFSPIYFFGVILIDDVELQLICPSAMLFGFNLVHRALFVRHNLNNTRSMLVGIGFLCVGISSSGLVTMYSNDRGTYQSIVLLYSAVGGQEELLKFEILS